MKRVLSIATLYPNPHQPRFGTFVARSMEALAARGDWDVTVINPIGIPPIALGRYAPLRDAAIDGVEHGVRVYRPVFPLIPRLGGRLNPKLAGRSALPLALKLHEQRPFDLVDAPFFYPDGPAAMRVAAELALPLNIKARGSDIAYWSNLPFAREQMLQAAECATGLLAVSSALADEMADIGMDRSKIAIHLTGLDRDRFRPLDHTGLRRTLAQEIGFALPEAVPLIVSVGALIPLKGQELVIRALPQLDDARLVLVGQGPDEARLRAIAAEIGVNERVHFTGSINHDLLPVILSAADVMALPSAREGLANAWVEALACGTPLVITDVGGARDVVTGPEAGELVERTVPAIAGGVTQVLHRKTPAETVAACAERFDWTSHAARLAGHYTRLIGG